MWEEMYLLYLKKKNEKGKPKNHLFTWGAEPTAATITGVYRSKPQLIEAINTAPQNHSHYSNHTCPYHTILNVDISSDLFYKQNKKQYEWW